MSGGAGAVLYTRRACPLCYTLRRLAERSARRHGVGLFEADVDVDPALAERYGSRVPVLELPGGISISGKAAASEVDEAFHRAAAFLRGLETSESGRTAAAPPRSFIARLRRALGRGGAPAGEPGP